MVGPIEHHPEPGILSLGFPEPEPEGKLSTPIAGTLASNIRTLTLVLHTAVKETEAPTQVKDGNLRLSTRFLEHRPVTSPPTNQKKVTHPAALTPNFAYKTFPENHRRVQVF